MSIFDKVGAMAADAAKQAQANANPPAQTGTTTTPAAATTTTAGSSGDNVAAQGVKLKVTTQSSNLNIRNSPNTDGEIVGKAAHGESVTLVRRESDDWWMIRTEAGEEGYASSQYLTLE